LHGGASTGPSKGSQNNLKHGIYSAVIRDEEKDLASEMRASIGKLDDEILICRIQLHRALQAQNAADEGDGLDLEEDIKRIGGGENAPGDETRRKRRDYTAIIDRLAGRIESLERTRAALMKDDEPGDDDMTRDDTVILKPDEPIPDNPVV
jgi:hypothetical protein